MTIGYVIHSGYWYGDLRFVPYSGSIDWAPSAIPQAAHVFTVDQALAIVDALPAEWQLTVLSDYLDREPMPIPENAQVPVPRAAVRRTA